MLPIDIDITNFPKQAEEPDAGAHLELFAAGQRAELEGLFDGSDSLPAWIERATPGDIGLGLPELVATRVYRSTAAPVRFGASQRTLDEAPDEVERKTWMLAPAVCISLWSTSSLPVLTIERLEPRPADDELLDACRHESYAGDVVAAMASLLEGTGLASDFSLGDIFTLPSRRWFDRRRSPAHWVEPVVARRVKGTEHVRGVAVTECLLAVTAPSATALVDSLVEGSDDEFEQAETDQVSGTTRAWEPIEIVDEPAEFGASSAVRSDSRYLLLNLEAMSIHHDYRGVASGGMLAAALPVVAARAAAAKDYAWLVDQFGPQSTEANVDERIAAVERLRLGVLRRKMITRYIAVEGFRAWTTPGALASELYERFSTAMNELIDDSVEASEVAQSMLDRIREERHGRNERLIQALSPAAGVVALGSLFAALASVPSPGEPSLLAALPDALAVTVGLVAVAAAGGAGYFISRR